MAVEGRSPDVVALQRQANKLDTCSRPRGRSSRKRSRLRSSSWRDPERLWTFPGCSHLAAALWADLLLERPFGPTSECQGARDHGCAKGPPPNSAASTRRSPSQPQSDWEAPRAGRCGKVLRPTITCPSVNVRKWLVKLQVNSGRTHHCFRSKLWPSRRPASDALLWHDPWLGLRLAT